MVRDREQGFTLVEMLVALVLLALIAGFSATTLASLSRLRNVEATLDSQSTVDSVRRHLRSTISGMRVVFAGASQTNVRLYFVGKPDSIEFAGALDDHSEYGGLYRIGYNVRSSPPALSLSYRIFRAINDTSLPQQMDILAGAAALHFQYYGDVDGEGTLKWSPNWIDRDTLPKLVSLTVDFSPGDKRHWPPLVIAVETAN